HGRNRSRLSASVQRMGSRLRDRGSGRAHSLWIRRSGPATNHRHHASGQRRVAARAAEVRVEGVGLGPLLRLSAARGRGDQRRDGLMTAVSVRRAIAQSGLVPVDAHALLGHVLGRNRAWIAAHGDDMLAPEQADAFLALARRRREGEPVAYLTGIREFHGLPLELNRAVLIPRPETETLVEVALAHLPADRDTRVLDLGTGSGAIALAIAHERPRARVIATDASPAALALARTNTQRLGLGNVEFVQSDWYASLP